MSTAWKNYYTFLVCSYQANWYTVIMSFYVSLCSYVRILAMVRYHGHDSFCDRSKEKKIVVNTSTLI